MAVTQKQNAPASAEVGGVESARKIRAVPDESQKLAKRFQEVGKKIASAENTAILREKDLNKLQPDFDKLAQECQDVFGCSLSELEGILKEKEGALANLIVDLERDLRQAAASDGEERPPVDAGALIERTV